MKKNEVPKPPKGSQNENPEPEGYPLYPPSEDIYSQFKEEQDIDPEDVTRTKEPVEQTAEDLEEDEALEDDVMGAELDIPGADLDDDMEAIGNEDEENNFYSIGGDNHHDLEENDGLLDEEI